MVVVDRGESPVSAAAVHETHVSVIFLVGDHAAKLKKPVRFDFVDLSTREARQRICEREVALNRRLAPDVYLGVYDLVDPDGHPVDHLVMMRRMPDDRRLSSLVRREVVPGGAIRALARTVASFHSRADTSERIASVGRPDLIASRWEDGFAEMDRLTMTPAARALEDEIESRVRRYLAGRERLFEARIAQGRIRDGHGDLLADDVFLLDDGPRVLDCLEFDDELRYGDVLADIGFLAMDLERLGAPGLATELLTYHREFTGDTYPATLAHLYVAMRAHIRAKVAGLRAEQGARTSAPEVEALLGLAVQHLREARVPLVLVGGAPGTGKSTLTAGIADRFGWTVLRSDEVRKDLAGIGHLDRSAAPGPDRGIYTDGHTRATYGELLDRARVLLELGEPVVLDASWARGEFRSEARHLAESVAADVAELRCEIDPETAARRTAARARLDRDPSDATPTIARAIERRFDAWPTAVEIATDGPPAASLDHAIAAVRAAGAGPINGAVRGAG